MMNEKVIDNSGRYMKISPEFSNKTISKNHASNEIVYKKSNVKFKNQLKRKTNPAIIEIIRKAGKMKEWRRVAEVLVGATKKYSSINLSEIDKKSEAGDTIVVLGKVLSKGELTKRLRICALSFSKSAEEKINKNKSEAVLLIHEINKNHKAEGIKILQ